MSYTNTVMTVNSSTSTLAEGVQNQSLVEENQNLRAALEEQNQKVNAAMALYIQEQSQNERLNEILTKGNQTVKAEIEESIRASAAITKENELLLKTVASLKDEKQRTEQVHAAKDKNAQEKIDLLTKIIEEKDRELETKDALLRNIYLAARDHRDITQTISGGGSQMSIMAGMKVHQRIKQCVADLDPYYGHEVTLTLTERLNVFREKK